MIDSVALIAPISPPLTGASSIEPPFCRDQRREPLGGDGEMLLMSMTIAPVWSAREHAVGAGQHVLDVRRVRQHRDDDGRRRATSAGEAAAVRAGRDELVHGAAAAVVDDEAIARLDQVSAPWACP